MGRRLCTGWGESPYLLGRRGRSQRETVSAADRARPAAVCYFLSAGFSFLLPRVKKS